MNQYKKAAKFLVLFLLCGAVIAFLYSRMHVEYSVQPGGAEEPDRTAEQGGSGEKRVEFPKVYQKYVSDSLNFDVEVVVPEEFTEVNITKATASLIDLDQEKFYEYFMGDSGSVETADYEGNTDAGGNGYILHVSEDAEGHYLALSSRTATFFADNPMYYITNIFISDSKTDEYNADKFSISENLDFQSREEAWEDVKDTARALGMDMEEAVPYMVFSLDLETLKAEEKRLAEVFGSMETEEQNSRWSDDAEGYQYYIGQQHQGLPIYESTKVEVNSPEEFWKNSSLQVYQTQNGIVGFSLNRWFRIQEQEGIYSLVDFETVMESLEEKYSGTINTNPLTVEQARLCKFPVQTGKNEFELTPIWICTLAEELPDAVGGTYINRMQIPMNAITGEEMPELEWI